MLVQEAHKLLAGPRGYGHLCNLWRMVLARRQYMVAQVSMLYPVKELLKHSPEGTLHFNSIKSGISLSVSLVSLPPLPLIFSLHSPSIFLSYGPSLLYPSFISFIPLSTSQCSSLFPSLSHISYPCRSNLLVSVNALIGLSFFLLKTSYHMARKKQGCQKKLIVHSLG